MSNSDPGASSGAGEGGQAAAASAQAEVPHSHPDYACNGANHHPMCHELGIDPEWPYTCGEDPQQPGIYLCTHYPA